MNYLAILLAFAAAFGIAAAAAGASLLLGPKKVNTVKPTVYECGVPAVGSAHERLSVKFYLTAILFILFDMETVFLYLWASVFGSLGWFGIVEVGLFTVTLLAGYVYILKRGALQWE